MKSKKRTILLLFIIMILTNGCESEKSNNHKVINNSEEVVSKIDKEIVSKTKDKNKKMENDFIAKISNKTKKDLFKLENDFLVKEKVIIDFSTNLMWQKNKQNISLKHSKSYCSNLTLDGYKDWRLPDEYEIASLIDLKEIGDAKKGIVHIHNIFEKQNITFLLSSKKYFTKGNGSDIRPHERFYGILFQKKYSKIGLYPTSRKYGNADLICVRELKGKNR